MTAIDRTPEQTSTDGLDPATILAQATRIGAEVAGPAADAVDAEPRFPSESLAALRQARLLSVLVPGELGGWGADVPTVAEAIRVIAAQCASSALVFAMHNIDVGNLVRHGSSAPLRELLRRIAADQLLMANANSEVGIGGDTGRSICALERDGRRWRLEKQALAISYGASADLIATKARPDASAQETDQVYIVCRRQQTTLEPRSDWNTVGLRGTQSPSFLLVAEGDEDDIYPVPWSTVANRTGLQLQQIFLSAVWVGLAEAAGAKAHRYVREEARRNVGSLSPSAMRLSELSVDLQQARDRLRATARRFEEVKDSDEVESPDFLVALRSLKVSTSNLAVDVVRRAVTICGIAGYKKDSPFAMDRLLRDAFGGLVMVSNDRYLQANAQMLVVRKSL
jgi:acyl-CoA dehydrogenase